MESVTRQQVETIIEQSETRIEKNQGLDLYTSEIDALKDITVDKVLNAPWNKSKSLSLWNMVFESLYVGYMYGLSKQD